MIEAIFKGVSRVIPKGGCVIENPFLSDVDEHARCDLIHGRLMLVARTGGDAIAVLNAVVQVGAESEWSVGKRQALGQPAEELGVGFVGEGVAVAELLKGGGHGGHSGGWDEHAGLRVSHVDGGRGEGRQGGETG